ncbi:hypothetical protein MG290_01555 [Flavobacterium sp. CBA20B-1]|uniref:hypothetical protein n=1 Tax=unclassified Flavobacterium TaxID=196869 RepID=UPI0022240B28|nr:MULTISPECIES: hypothetical protein [unclassified Flavobacterium]WCM42381.1 hypothetical protein MG290_01555 [Flavobacterium sp. CBA20B-1]
MKYNPFKVILWLLFLTWVLLNSVRLFIYGFVISFIIVIIDRAFFGTRKRSDKQFVNLFCTFTVIAAICYTFSPYFRSLEFKISHPKWNKLEVVSIHKEETRKVSTPLNFLEMIYTPVAIHYVDEKGAEQIKNEKIKHYAIVGVEPFFSKQIIEKELEYIHERSLNKLIDKKAVNLYQHPLKDKMKMFKGNDAFALRHSIGFQIALLLAYLLAITLSIYTIFNYRKLKKHIRSASTKERKTACIILFILLYSYAVVAITIIHYLKFK